jgi:hypothetical protein
MRLLVCGCVLYLLLVPPSASAPEWHLRPFLYRDDTCPTSQLQYTHRIMCCFDIRWSDSCLIIGSVRADLAELT